MTHQEFIDILVPLISKYCKQYNYPFVSPILAQAILESNWGTSYKAVTGMNFFGLKYQNQTRTPSASGFFCDGGFEQNKDGSYTNLSNQTKWCKFSNYDNGVHGYFEFLINGYGRYNNLTSATSPLDYLQKIRADGYATDLKYVDKVYAVIAKNNLTQYDNQQKQTVGQNNVPQSTDDINIIQKTGIKNTTAAANRKIDYIVLHYTAGTSSKKGAAANIANFFGTTAKASADFIVDDETIVQYNPDPKNRYTWAVGGNKYTTLSTSLGAKYYGIAKNSNTISIEMCSGKTNKKSLQATDTDWFITDATVTNAAKLTNYLMKKYNISKDHVIMHHMVTGKVCPNPWCVNENALTGWRNFLTKLN